MSEETELLQCKEIAKFEYETEMSFEWWQKNAIYHIYLPSFKDSNNDGIGDFQGLISKLQYLEDLNVKTLLLSPFYPSPMKDNGYDVSSYIDIDPVYGTMDDFNDLMKELKEREMNIVVDLVINHTSDQHLWFQKSIKKEEPYSDFYIWADKKPESTDKKRLPPNNWLSVFGGSAWTWNEHRKQFYFHQFLPEQPDLNFRNSIVREEIKNVIIFWLEKGVDGFRIDAASHLFEDERLLDEPICKNSKAKMNEHEFLDHIYTKGLKENFDLLKEFRVVLDNFESKMGKSKIMVTEVCEELKDVMKYYGGVGDKIADFPFNFQLYKVNATSTGIDLFETIDLWLRNMPKGKYPNWVVSSHDDPRVVSRAGKRLASSLQIIIMLLPGIPICYYGDELGMENTNIKYEDIRDSFALRTSPENSRDPMRTPMQWDGRKNSGFTDGEKPWLPVNANYETVNVEAEKDDPSSFLSIFRSSMKFRVEPTILVGLLEYPLVNKDVFSFLRYLVGAKCFLLVLNMGPKSACIDLSNTSHLLPHEGFLELSNGHIRDSDDVNSFEPFQCECQDKDFSTKEISSASSSSSQIKIPLNSIHLQSKEAVVLSFISKQRT